MKRLFTTLIVLFVFWRSAMAFSFIVESYMATTKDSIQGFEYNKPASFELKTDYYGEKYLQFLVTFDQSTHHAFAAWFKKEYNSRFMLCDLRDDTKGVVVSVYVLTYKERCLIFYPESEDRVTIYDINTKNIKTHYYQVFKAYGKGLYKNIIHEIGEAYSQGAITATGCDGYLNGIYIKSSKPTKD